METPLNFDTEKILKKLIKSYIKDTDSEFDAQNMKEYYVNDSIENGSKIYLKNALTDGTGNYTTQLAQHLLLLQEEEKGVSKLEQGLYWIYNYTLVEDLNNQNSPFGVYDLGFTIGMSWLFKKQDMLMKSLGLLEKYWKLHKSIILPNSFHVSFLYLLYKEIFLDFRQYFHTNDNIYIKLLENITKPNKVIEPILDEACDNHLIHTTIMGNKIADTEFFWLPLYPYEIFCYICAREKLGFDKPKIKHKLMQTTVATANLSLSKYKVEEDMLLNKLLGKIHNN